MQMKPLETPQTACSTRSLQPQLHHARQMLGIVASSKGRKILPMATHAAVLASMALVDRREQAEALRILEGTGSRNAACMRAVEQRLKHKWAWREADEADVDGPAARPGGKPVEGGGGGSTSKQWPWNEAEARANPASFNHPDQPYKTWYLA